MRAFCRPVLSPAVWVAGIQGYLTQDAARAYASVLPARVPCTRAGSARVADAADSFTQEEAVPTDAGVCIVTLQRPDARSPWRVSRITLPGRQ